VHSLLPPLPQLVQAVWVEALVGPPGWVPWMGPLAGNMCPTAMLNHSLNIFFLKAKQLLNNMKPIQSVNLLGNGKNESDTFMHTLCLSHPLISMPQRMKIQLISMFLTM